jgi:molybdopterin-binding protein
MRPELPLPRNIRSLPGASGRPPASLSTAGLISTLRRGSSAALNVGRKSQIESVVTRRGAEELQLKKGDRVRVVIKSTEVMLDKG